MTLPKASGHVEIRRVINDWCDRMEKEYGAEHTLTARPDLWQKLDPIEEAQAMVGKDKVIPIVI